MIRIIWKWLCWLDYKPTRYEGKGFLRNLNIRIHRDITGEMWFGVMKTEMLIFIS
jgi:hypothetical protein